MVHNCPFCSAKIEAGFKFCGLCGKQLKKTCFKCNIKFESTFNYCGQCGNCLEKSTIDPNFKSKSQKKTDLAQNLGIKVKVGILFGFDLNSIKIEQGGGSRRIYLNRSDGFNIVLGKLTNLYFPKNGYTCLGNTSDYRINMLDFKKQLLNYNNFKSVSTYVEAHGLTLQVKPIFFLHLIKNNRVANSSSLVAMATSSNDKKEPQIGHVVNNIKQEPLDFSESRLQSSTQVSSNEKISSISSASSSESENEGDKNKPLSQNVGYESLRQKHKLLNPTASILSKKRPKKRDSSISSISSSSSTASFRKARQLDKKLNRRLQSLKNETCQDTKANNQNGKALLPTPNKTPSAKANTPDRLRKSDNSSNKISHETGSIDNDNIFRFKKHKYDQNCSNNNYSNGSRYFNYSSSYRHNSNSYSTTHNRMSDRDKKHYYNTYFNKYSFDKYNDYKSDNNHRYDKRKSYS